MIFRWIKSSKNNRQLRHFAILRTHVFWQRSLCTYVWRLPSREDSYLFSSFNVGSQSFLRREVLLSASVISMSLCSCNTTPKGHTLLHHPRSRVGILTHHSGTMSVLPVLTQYLAIPPIGMQCSQTSFRSVCTESDEWLDIATYRRNKSPLQQHQQIKGWSRVIKSCRA